MHYALCSAQRMQTKLPIPWAHLYLRGSQETIIKQQQQQQKLEKEKCCGKKKSMRSKDNYSSLVFFFFFSLPTSIIEESTSITSVKCSTYHHNYICCRDGKVFNFKILTSHGQQIERWIIRRPDKCWLNHLVFFVHLSFRGRMFIHLLWSYIQALLNILWMVIKECWLPTPLRMNCQNVIIVSWKAPWKGEETETKFKDLIS